MKSILEVSVHVPTFDRDDIGMALEDYLVDNDTCYGNLGVFASDLEADISHECLSTEYEGEKIYLNIETLDTSTGILLEQMLKTNDDDDHYPLKIGLSGTIDRDTLVVTNTHIMVE